MRAFVLRILFFAVLFIVSSNLLVRFNFAALKEYLYYNGDYVWLKTISEKPKIAFFGSSTFYYGINPNIIRDQVGLSNGEVVSFAQKGRTPIQSYYIFKSNLPYLKNLKCVFYSLDPWFYSDYYYHTDKRIYHKWSAKEKLNYLREADLNSCLQLTCGGENGTRLFIPFVLSKLRSVHPPSAPEYYGGNVDQGNVNRNFEEQIHDNADLKKWYKSDLFDFSTLQMQYIAGIKKLCDEKNIEFFLVLPPKSDKWVSTYSNTCREIDSTFVNLFNSEIGDCRICGSYSSLQKSSSNNFFLDDVHLNYLGQVEFSKQLSEVILNASAYEPSKIRNTYLYK